jgi:hypothetical protein
MDVRSLNRLSTERGQAALTTTGLSNRLQRRFCHHTLETVVLPLDPVLKSCAAVGEEACNPERFLSRLDADLIENVRSECILVRCVLSVPRVFARICAHVKPFPLREAGMRTRQQRCAHARPV